MDGFIAFLKTGTADSVLFVALSLSPLIALLIGIVRAANYAEKLSAKDRPYQPPKRPVSDNNTTPLPKEKGIVK